MLRRWDSYSMTRTVSSASIMSSIGVSRPSPDERRQSLLRAVETRAQQNAITENVKTLAQVHETKQNFRRLLDPGIVRPNNKESAELAIKVNTSAIPVLLYFAETRYRHWKHCLPISSASLKIQSSEVSSLQTMQSRSVWLKSMEP